MPVEQHADDSLFYFLRVELSFPLCHMAEDKELCGTGKLNHSDCVCGGIGEISE